MGNEINIWLNRNPFTDRKRAKPYSDRILQHLLQNALNTSHALSIHKNPNGKPYVKEPIFFSHSNSHQLHAYVISQQHEVAIDVEAFNHKKSIDQLSKRYFAAAEVKELQALRGAEKTQHFFDLWTQKEAWCKLEGGNLWGYLGKNVQENQSFNFYTVNTIKNYAMTLATPGTINKIWINSIGNQ